MQAPDTALEIGTRLRSAIEAGRFDIALPLIEDYGKAVKQALRTAKNDAELAAVHSDAAGFLGDRLQFARILRSHLAARAKAACRLASYAANPHLESTWRIDG